MFSFYSLAQEMGGDSPLTSCVQNIVVVSLIESLRLELSLTQCLDTTRNEAPISSTMVMQRR